MAQKVFEIRVATNGTETNELLHTGTDGHPRVWQNVEEHANFRRLLSSSRGGKNWRIEGLKKRITRKVYQRLANELDMEGFAAQQGLWNFAKRKIPRERGELPKEEGDVIGENTRLCMKKIS